jgi:hypothetical protein
MSEAIKTSKRRRTPDLLAIFYLLIGPIVWTLHFAATYALQSVLCALDSPARTVLRVDPVLLVVVSATVLALIILAHYGISNAQGSRRLGFSGNQTLTKFLARTMELLCFLAAIAILWTGVSALMLHPCAPLR